MEKLRHCHPMYNGGLGCSFQLGYLKYIVPQLHYFKVFHVAYAVVFHCDFWDEIWYE